MTDNVVGLGVDKDLLSLAEEIVRQVKTKQIDGLVVFTYKQGDSGWNDWQGLVDVGTVHLDCHVLMLEIAQQFIAKD